MKRKAFKRTRKRVRRAIDRVLPWFLLEHYALEVLYYDSYKDFKECLPNASEFALMNVKSDWRYLWADIRVNTPEVAKLDDDGIEKCIVHELIHVIVDEMGCTDKTHEERAVTTLQKVVMRARYAGYQQGLAEHAED